ncbi:7-cyano-7-deazaguanine synthase QueC [bacterium]|jgi:7-cyano-7-deazaguanine synthase|nr:7-cyano-7-deazaguanine synthase QueC [bacterium]
MKTRKALSKYEKAVVLFSGGQDSTTCLAYALHKFKNVEAIGFNYGQRHNVELIQAQKIADKLNVKLTIMKLAINEEWSSSALLNENEIVSDETSECPNSFVPGRNLVFLNHAAIYAHANDISNLVIGACQTDFSGYPDCRNEFIDSAERVLNLAFSFPFVICAPLMWLSKADTIKMMDSLNYLDLLKDTHTCYYGKRPACGKCPSCTLRLKGFVEAGKTDPLIYSATSI